MIWRASTGTFFYLTSSSGYNYAAQGQKQWGNSRRNDIPMLGDIDGDGGADLVIWRPGTGTWFWLTSSSGYNLRGAGPEAVGRQRRHPDDQINGGRCSTAG